MEEFQIVALLGLFFGLAFWAVFKGLIANQTLEIKRLQELLGLLRERIDKVEMDLHKCELEKLEVEGQLDDYVLSNQMLHNQIRDLKSEFQILKGLADDLQHSRPEGNTE